MKGACLQFFMVVHFASGIKHSTCLFILLLIRISFSPKIKKQGIFINARIFLKSVVSNSFNQEEREFLYAQDCCEALETVMNNYSDFNSNDELHVTSFSSIKIIDIAQIIQQKFSMIGKKIDIKPSIDTDTVQQNSKNVASKYLTNWWKPTTSLDDGIAKVFASMKKNYD